MKYTAKQVAYLLAHAYTHDTRPPDEAVRQGLGYKGVSCEAEQIGDEPEGRIWHVSFRVSENAIKQAQPGTARHILEAEADLAIAQVLEHAGVE